MAKCPIVMSRGDDEGGCGRDVDDASTSATQTHPFLSPIKIVLNGNGTLKRHKVWHFVGKKMK
jgi:hypothetical protein